VGTVRSRAEHKKPKMYALQICVLFDTYWLCEEQKQRLICLATSLGTEYKERHMKGDRLI
jgi:hypothetical protein